MKCYTLKKSEDTAELHLFEGNLTPNGPKVCTSGISSVCGKMEASQSEGNIFACKTEQDARERCAKQGRSVCGICVSHLYADF